MGFDWSWYRSFAIKACELFIKLERNAAVNTNKSFKDRIVSFSKLKRTLVSLF